LVKEGHGKGNVGTVTDELGVAVEEGVEGPKTEGEGNINNRKKHEYKDHHRHHDADEGVRAEELLEQ